MTNTVAVLDACERHGITLGRKKCLFAQTEVKFAGAVVNADGVVPDPDLLRALSEFPEPKNRTDLKSFCGLAEQLGRFCKEKSELLQPLRKYQGTAEGRQWFWDEAATEAFKRARSELTKTSRLAWYDGKKALELHTDAS